MEMVFLETPLNAENVKKLRAGEIVFLNGTIFAARDQATHRMLENLRAIPRGAVVYHCGPLVKKTRGKWLIISAGPTTSARMNALLPAFVKKLGVRAIIGKGGVSKAVAQAMKGRCVYLAAIGGCGALYARCLRVRRVRWLELGEPEALWVLEARGFGPLVVAIDARGKNLFARRVRWR